MSKKAEKSGNPVSNAVSFVGESVEELKKVHPPSKQDTIQTTIRVLLMVFMFGAFLGLTDYIVGNVMKAVLT